jgi:MinD-like ATPase involved in chromosome partitioning or flagellar assembly
LAAERTFIPLFADPEAGACVAILNARLDPEAAVCIQPPVTGLAFIATSGEVSRMLDAWWEASVPDGTRAVLLALHEPGLEEWAPSLDADLVVGVARVDDLGLYAGAANVRPLVTKEPREVTEHAIRCFPECFGRPASPDSHVPPAESTPFRPRIQAPHVPPAEQRRMMMPGPPRPETEPEALPPFERRDLRSLLGRAAGFLSARAPAATRELARLALANRTGRVVGVASRAGGVGKTAVAAALGIIYGEAVQDSGWCAAVIDQNIGNPDQWGRLNLTTRVRTVSEIMADIEAGREWSVPAWGRTPALAVYPERRDVGDGYSPAQIERFAAQLRQLHMISIVDLPNRIPAFTSAEASVCAGWIACSDLLLLPTTDDPTRLQGVLDYLQAPMVRGDAGLGYRGIPVIVPYIRSPLRAVREDPGVRSMLGQVRQRVVAVVDIPKNERATLAIVRGQPITEVDAGLRDAYLELATVVARTLQER